MAIGGAFLRFGQTGFRILELLAAIVALGIYSYFLAVLHDHHVHIPTWERAVEGISGSAVLYLLFAVLLTLCLGGFAFFALIAVLLDIAFMGGFIYVAWKTRHSANSCSGVVNTPLGTGSAGTVFNGESKHAWVPNLHEACRLNTAVFAVSIILVFLFAITAVLQVLLVRHHKKEKRYGPSPSNNYTSGAGRRPFWKRNKRSNNTRDAEIATAGAGIAGTHAMRPSHDTGYTGTTSGMNDMNLLNEAKYGEPGYGQAGHGQGYVAPAHHTTTTTATNY